MSIKDAMCPRPPCDFLSCADCKAEEASASDAREQLTRVTPPEGGEKGAGEACEAWGCDGKGMSHQGTSYKSGYPEKQYAPCGRRCLIPPGTGGKR